MVEILIPQFPRQPLILRQFPGKKRFSKVSLDDLEVSLPVKDKDGWGHVNRVDAGIASYAPDGELIVARRWPSRSYTRNFARIIRNVLGFFTTLRTRGGVDQNTPFNTADGNGIIPTVTLSPSGAASNTGHSGAMMLVGDGVALEDHTRDDVVNEALPIVPARNSVRTTVQDTTTITHQVDAAIANGGASSLNITEIALFMRGLDPANSSTAQAGYDFLLAYDGVASTPVAAGGSIAPRFILDFPV